MNSEVKNELKIIWTHIKKLCSLLHLGFLNRVRTVIINNPIVTFRVLSVLLILVILGSITLIKIISKSSSDREMRSTYVLEQKIDSLEMTHHADSVLLNDMRSKLKSSKSNQVKSTEPVRTERREIKKSEPKQIPEVKTQEPTKVEKTVNDNSNKNNDYE